jgi:hypothetical protein
MGAFFQPASTFVALGTPRGGLTLLNPKVDKGTGLATCLLN